MECVSYEIFENGRWSWFMWIQVIMLLYSKWAMKWSVNYLDLQNQWCRSSSEINNIESHIFLLYYHYINELVDESNMKYMLTKMTKMTKMMGVSGIYGLYLSYEKSSSYF